MKSIFKTMNILIILILMLGLLTACANRNWKKSTSQPVVTMTNTPGEVDTPVITQESTKISDGNITPLAEDNPDHDLTADNLENQLNQLINANQDGDAFEDVK